MIGLVILLLLTAGGLYWSGVRGAMLQMSAAALLFGAVGYTIQGRPSLNGSPRAERTSAAAIPLTPIRHAFFGQFTAAERWLLISESYARRGNTANAAGILRTAVREYPDDPALWVGLGNALIDHAGVITPAAELAFSRAQELAPGHPAARFFYGLALARSGDGAAGVREWRQVLAAAPADASWRPLVEDAILALSRPAISRPAR